MLVDFEVVTLHGQRWLQSATVRSRRSKDAPRKTRFAQRDGYHIELVEFLRVKRLPAWVVSVGRHPTRFMAWEHDLERYTKLIT